MLDFPLLLSAYLCLRLLTAKLLPSLSPCLHCESPFLEARALSKGRFSTCSVHVFPTWHPLHLPPTNNHLGSEATVLLQQVPQELWLGAAQLLDCLWCKPLWHASRFTDGSPQGPALVHVRARRMRCEAAAHDLHSQRKARSLHSIERMDTCMCQGMAGRGRSCGCVLWVSAQARHRHALMGCIESCEPLCGVLAALLTPIPSVQRWCTPIQSYPQAKGHISHSARSRPNLPHTHLVRPERRPTSAQTSPALATPKLALTQPSPLCRTGLHPSDPAHMQSWLVYATPPTCSASLHSFNPTNL